MTDFSTRCPPSAKGSQDDCGILPRQGCSSNSVNSRWTSNASSRKHTTSCPPSSPRPSVEPAISARVRRARECCALSKTALSIAVLGMLLWTVRLPPRAAFCLSFSANSAAPGREGEGRAAGAGATAAARDGGEAGAAGRNALPCLTLAACRTETDALLLLQQHTAGGGEQQQQQTNPSTGGDMLQQKQQQGTAAKEASQQHELHRGQEQQPRDGLDAYVELALRRGWWAAAREVILASHRAGVDVSSVVRRTVQEIRDELDETVRLLDKRHYEIQVVPPAFQWAQSPEEIFLNVKFAYRWSSPGALSVSDPSFHSEARRFSFSGVGLHSGVQKKYSLTLSLYSEIDPDATKYSFASLGRVVVTLQKKKPAIWERLTKDTAKISNMNVWWDMKEKYQKELDEFRKGGNKTKSASADTGAANSSGNETSKANSNSSSSSKSSGRSAADSKAAAPSEKGKNSNAASVEAESGRREEL